MAQIHPMLNNLSTYHQHIPVMLNECINGLITEPNGIYIDGTLGGGGHSKEILSHLNKDGRLFSIDQDDQAIAAASAHIGNDKRLSILKGNFGYLSTILPSSIHGQINGILLDLGVSTHQIKEGTAVLVFKKIH